MPGKQKRGGKDSCLEELAASSLEAAWRFPPALRLFVLFLEAADSHRLNKSLLRQVHSVLIHVKSPNQAARCMWTLALMPCYEWPVSPAEVDPDRSSHTIHAIVFLHVVCSCCLHLYDALDEPSVGCMVRCMQQRLSSLHAEAAGARSGHMPQRCEQAIAMAALACFIAHLTAGAPLTPETLCILNLSCVPSVRGVLCFLHCLDLIQLHRVCSVRRCIMHLTQRSRSVHSLLYTAFPAACASAELCSQSHDTAGQLQGLHAAGDKAAADLLVNTALTDAMRGGALLWTLPWVTSYAVISSAQGLCRLTVPLRAQLAHIRSALPRRAAPFSRIRVVSCVSCGGPPRPEGVCAKYLRSAGAMAGRAERQTVMP